GRFSITSNSDRAIAEGSITVIAAKEGYRTKRTTVRGTDGATASVRLTLAAKVAPTTKPPSPAAAKPLAADDTPAA
ncbi:hypothetical protein, partial [Salmonella enterica]